MSPGGAMEIATIDMLRELRRELEAELCTVKAELTSTKILLGNMQYLVKQQGGLIEKEKIAHERTASAACGWAFDTGRS